MTFAVFVPPQATARRVPALWYLSGLTCTHANSVEKGEYRRLAAELGIIVVYPDTSPLGEIVPDEPDNWQFGKGAGFYVDATEPPLSANYRMYSYIVDELPKIVATEFNSDMTRQGIFGHSIGGHGAITIALKNSGRFRSCSAFAPICHPSAAGWSRPAFTKYLGADEVAWHSYDTCALIEDGKRFAEYLVDQGSDDAFLAEGLRPTELKTICKAVGIKLTPRMHEGYGHPYFFMFTFRDDHLRWHAERLAN